ncbi:MAG: biopolymer transporter ExbD [Geminicoccaceae bacterium]
MAATVTPAKGQRGRRRQRTTMVAINMTPLVDVMLVLLIVFMITAPLLSAGVSVDLPEADSAPLPGQDEPLSVSIDAKGEVFLQDTAVTVEQLGPRLQAITGRNPDARIFVRGDRQIDYGKVMAVVSAINQAGFGKVALLTAPFRTAATP